MAKKTQKKRAGVPPASQPEPGTPDTAPYPGAPRFRTVLCFGIIFAVAHAAIWLFSLTGNMRWIYRTAPVVSWLLTITGIPNAVDGNIIYLKNDTWNVTSECTAINAVLLFASFLLAYPATPKAKLVGVVTGVPLIVAVNIARLVALGWVTEYWPGQARFFHDYVWEILFILFIVTLWYAWVNLVVSREKTPAPSCKT